MFTFVRLPALSESVALIDNTYSIFFPAESSTQNLFATLGGFVVG